MLLVRLIPETIKRVSSMSPVRPWCRRLSSVFSLCQTCHPSSLGGWTRFLSLSFLSFPRPPSSLSAQEISTAYFGLWVSMYFYSPFSLDSLPPCLFVQVYGIFGILLENYISVASCSSVVRFFRIYCHARGLILREMTSSIRCVFIFWCHIFPSRV